MMKLKLKHLAPYLPYKLRVQYWDRNVVMNSGQGSSTNWIGINALLQRQGEKQNCYPILRPLSDIMEEIEHNGEKFFPCAKLTQSWNWSVVSESKDNFNHIDYTSMVQLFEWHFDVFGLISEGLAIAYE